MDAKNVNDDVEAEADWWNSLVMSSIRAGGDHAHVLGFEYHTRLDRQWRNRRQACGASGRSAWPDQHVRVHFDDASHDRGARANTWSVATSAAPRPGSGQCNGKGCQHRLTTEGDAVRRRELHEDLRSSQEVCPW